MVVDPGVGSTRRPMLIELEGSYFIGPDNGVLSVAFEGNNRGNHSSVESDFSPTADQRDFSRTRYFRPGSGCIFRAALRPKLLVKSSIFVELVVPIISGKSSRSMARLYTSTASAICLQTSAQRDLTGWRAIRSRSALRDDPKFAVWQRITPRLSTGEFAALINSWGFWRSPFTKGTRSNVAARSSATKFGWFAE